MLYQLSYSRVVAPEEIAHAPRAVKETYRRPTRQEAYSTGELLEQAGQRTERSGSGMRAPISCTHSMRFHTTNRLRVPPSR